MLARLWQRRRSDEGIYSSIMGGICNIYKEVDFFVCFLPHYVSLSPEHWFITTSALSSHFSQLKNLRTLSPPKRGVENQGERCLNADFAACFKFLLPIWCFSGLHVQAGRPTMVAPYQGTLSPLHDCLVEHPPLLQLPFWNWSKMKNGLSELMKETPDQSRRLRHQD